MDVLQKLMLTGVPLMALCFVGLFASKEARERFWFRIIGGILLSEVLLGLLAIWTN